MKCCFVILHYMGLNDTVGCIKYIEQLQSNNCDIKIIVVDNASPNESGTELKRIFGENNDVIVLLEKENLGYAKGCNIGYRYAKNILKADYIVVMNNDIEIHTLDFLSKIKEYYKNEHYYILGPDIVDLKGKHQNPHRKEVLTLKQVNKKIIKRRIILSYLYMAKLIKSLRMVELLQKYENINAYNEVKTISHINNQENVVLQGSILVFSLAFIEKNQNAFCEDTFFYFEEDILCYMCKNNNWKTLYVSDINVKHLSGVSTSINRDELEVKLFKTKNLLKSAKVLRRLLMNNPYIMQ